ncbi:hypothetical protein N7517_004465 [Penicillium concentricum]|uniref:Uncharacterized protein n=1 Tax=Penicillium concentricum TaxID=293559 RepID=A0A9W9V9E5_9EURO|nr:uncharacterized protein N7517_004465 [Penicillium concentricum]KAJ5372459.1 hypothetical protein N7517_004465 [Penicillium concentricum]
MLQHHSLSETDMISSSRLSTATGKDMEETPHIAFLGGNLSWDSIFYDCFGQDVTQLLDQLNLTHDTTKDQDYLVPFQRLYGVGVLLYTSHRAEIGRFQSIPGYILSVTDKLAELRPFYNISRRDPAQDSIGNLTDIASEYETAAKNLRALCDCRECKKPVAGLFSHPEHRPGRTFCWVSVAATMLILTYLVGRCEFNSEIRPKKLGVMIIYQDINMRRNHGIAFKADTLLSHLTMGGFQSSPSFLFNSIMTLFTGSPSRIFFSVDYPSAHSNGTVYCYLNSLSDLSLD